MKVHTRKLSEREAKWVARAQAPARLGFQRRHRRWIQGILTHRIVRDISVPGYASDALSDGDIIQLGNVADVNAQGLFRVVHATRWSYDERREAE